MLFSSDLKIYNHSQFFEINKFWIYVRVENKMKFSKGFLNILSLGNLRQIKMKNEAWMRTQRMQLQKNNLLKNEINSQDFKYYLDLLFYSHIDSQVTSITSNIILLTTLLSCASGPGVPFRFPIVEWRKWERERQKKGRLRNRGRRERKREKEREKEKRKMK